MSQPKNAGSKRTRRPPRSVPPVAGIGEFPRMACPFTIVCDSDEKRPFHFVGIKSNLIKGVRYVYDVPKERRALPVGDYTIAGYEDQIIIERKSKEDFIQSVLRRENFIGRLEKMKRYRYSAVICEADIPSILYQRLPYGEYEPKMIMRQVQSWDLKYPTKWLLMPTRDIAETWTFRLFEHFHRHRTEELKKK